MAVILPPSGGAFSQRGGGYPRTTHSKLLDSISVRDFGPPSIGNGVGDDSDAFNAALALGVDVIVPAPDVEYRISKPLIFHNGSRLVGAGQAKLKWVSITSALIFDMTGCVGAGVSNLAVDGVNTLTPAGAHVLLSGAVGCELLDTAFINSPSAPEGSVILTGATTTRNTVARCLFTKSAGTGIGLVSGAYLNDIAANTFDDGGGFGIRVAASNNLLSGNKTLKNSIELIGVTSSGKGNRLLYNHAEGCGDNGISLSGDGNICIGNRCIRNARAGIHAWGSGNIIANNYCLSNNLDGAQWAGIGVSANYGGHGQNNVIVGNFCDDDQAVPTQFNGVRIGGTGYISWASGQVLSGSPNYRVHGLNVYIAVGLGTTGATPPTHTTGQVSDGGVVWRYQSTFLEVADSVGNRLSGNIIPRYASSAYHDASTAGLWVANQIDAEEVFDFRSSGTARLRGVSGVYLGSGATDTVRVGTADIRPIVNAATKLGLSTLQWQEVHSAGYFSGGNHVVRGRRSGWDVPTGTATRTSFATSTATTTELAERLKALIEDLTYHGLIGPTV